LQGAFVTIRSAVAVIVLICLFSVSRAEAGQDDSTQVLPGRIVLLSAITVGTVTAVHLYQARAWWEGPRAPFRFENDWVYALNIDKLGHAYGAYALSHLFTYSMDWSGFSHSTSIYYGSVLGLAYQLYVEVEDGFHQEYGFSPGDAFSDVIGAAIPLAQERFPVLKNFALKWSYYPSTEYVDALRGGSGRVFIDDYQGQTYYITMDPHFLMGDHPPWWIPPWLGVGFGLAARDLQNTEARRRLHIFSLDYNFTRIETESSLLRSVFTVLDHFHLPAPGLVLDGSTVKLRLVY
jgi:VanZ family protein